MVNRRAAATGCLLVAATCAAAAQGAPEAAGASATYGSWQVFCDKADGACTAVQAIGDPAGNEVLVMVVPDPPGEAVAGMTVATPADTDIGRGLTFILGDGQGTVRSAFQCFDTNCAISIGLGKRQLSDLRRGAPVSVLFYSKREPRGPFRIPLEMDGFREAFDSLPVPDGQHDGTRRRQ